MDGRLSETRHPHGYRGSFASCPSTCKAYLGRICWDNRACCHTETEAVDQACYVIQSQYNDTRPNIPSADRLVGLVIRRPPQERKIPGSNPVCAGIFFGVESYQRLQNWHSSGYPARRLAGTGRPGVSIL